VKNLFIVAAEKVAASWEQEAEQRVKRAPSDPVATALQSCAAELRERLADLERETAFLSVSDFALHRNMPEATVRRLCRNKELEGAVKDMNDDWRIPRDAVRVERRGQLKQAS